MVLLLGLEGRLAHLSARVNTFLQKESFRILFSGIDFLVYMRILRNMSNVHGSKWLRPEKRLAIYARDGFACLYCGSEERLTLDHLLARELGGTNDASNLVTACLTCNSSKQHATMREWFVILRRRGIDTKRMARNIRAHAAKPVDINLGKNLLAARKKA